MSAFVQRLVGFDETAMENCLARRIDYLELYPWLVHIAQFGRKRMSGFPIKDDHFRCYLFTRFKRDLVFLVQGKWRYNIASRLIPERKNIDAKHVVLQKGFR